MVKNFIKGQRKLTHYLSYLIGSENYKFLNKKIEILVEKSEKKKSNVFSLRDQKKS